MWQAINSAGVERWAWEATKAEAPFKCPGCLEPVLHKQEGKIERKVHKIAHFAHLAKSTCVYGEGESVEHMQCKRAIYDALRELELSGEAGISQCKLERKRSLEASRPDVSFYQQDASGAERLIAVEVQRSTLSVPEIEHRTGEYERQGVQVIWILTDSIEEFEDDLYTPKKWQQWLHFKYHRVYFWRQGIEVDVIRLEPLKQYLRLKRMVRGGKLNITDSKWHSRLPTSKEPT